MLDCQNGIPFFTPLVLPRRTPVLCVMHHVHTAQFGVHFPPWLAGIGRLLEGPAARLAYRRQGCVAVSPSTIAAMRTRLRWPGPVYLIPNGTRTPVAGEDGRSGTPAEGGQRPRLAWIGRLVAHKRAGLLIPVAARGYEIDVIGRGPGAAALSSAISRRRSSRRAADRAAMHLHGYLPEEEKNALASRGTAAPQHFARGRLGAVRAGGRRARRAHGRVRRGGPARLVLDGQTGWLVRGGEELPDVVDRAVRELADPGRRAEVAAACRAWAAQLSWERATARMAALVAACVRRGTSLAARPGAWIVAQGDDVVVAEGPSLDLALESGGMLLRRATATEHLLGVVSDIVQPADTAVAG